MRCIFIVVFFFSLITHVSYGQRRINCEKIKPAAIKPVDLNIKATLVEGPEYVNSVVKLPADTTVHYLNCQIKCYAQPFNIENLPSLDQIIYLNDLLYKRPHNYFPGK